MAGIKIFECAICKQLYENNVKGEERFIGGRKEVREHLRKVHQVNRRFGNATHKKLKGLSNDSVVTSNCILYKEYK